VDDEGPAMLKSCSEQEKDEARKISQKYLGTLPAISDSDVKTDFEGTV